MMVSTLTGESSSIFSYNHQLHLSTIEFASCRFLESFKLDETEEDANNKDYFNSETPPATSGDIYFAPETTSTKSTSGSQYVNDEYISSILKHTQLDLLSCSDFTKANFIKTSGVFSQNSDKFIESQS